MIRIPVVKARGAMRKGWTPEEFGEHGGFVQGGGASCWTVDPIGSWSKEELVWIREAQQQQARGLAAGSVKALVHLIGLRPDVIVPDPDNGGADWFPLELLASISLDQQNEELRRWTERGIKFIRNPRTIGAEFWTRAQDFLEQKGRAPVWYTGGIDYNAEGGPRVEVRGFVTDLNVSGFVDAVVPRMVAACDAAGTRVVNIAGKTGWYQGFMRNSPEGYWTGSARRPGVYVGGLFGPTPYGPGQWEKGFANIIREATKAGLLLMTNEAPAGAGGVWAWMVGPYSDIPDLLLGDHTAATLEDRT